MTRLQTLRHRWGRPALAGATIALSWLLGALGWALAADIAMVAASIIAGWPIAVAAIRALANRIVGIDLLVTVASVGAILVQNYWEAAAVTFLFTVGHALEQATLSKTRSALAELLATAPDEALLLRDGEQVRVPASQVAVDDVVLVKTGMKVPVDGVVSRGTGSIDEASITGESLPATKREGDAVFAGTIATAGTLQVRAERVAQDTTLARIIHRVEEAQDAKAPTQVFMDRFSRWYTPAIILLALITGLVTGDVVLALTLLVIGCPGALVISIPVAIVAGVGRGARDGILVKGGEYLETAARVDTVALDKTGTLTEGRPELTDVLPFDGRSRREVLGWAARAEASSDHPLAAPIVSAAREDGIRLGTLPEETEAHLGEGITATIDGVTVGVGNLGLVDRLAGDLATRDQVEAAMRDLADQGRTPMAVVVAGAVIGVVAVADAIRPEARSMVERLRRIGIRETVMLTGDRQAVAEAVAQAVGIDTVRAQLLPEDKLDAIKRLQNSGHTVAMVGDGVNDAPALATADIGVAMGAAGSAVAIETADIALMSDRLDRLPEALGLARRTVRVMRQNIGIALVTVALLLAGVFAGGVTMSVGMLVHEASVLVVIVNAMRLLRRPATLRSDKLGSRGEGGVHEETGIRPREVSGAAG